MSPLELPKDLEPTLRVRTRPNDANATGDIFGGWLMSQIDIACAIEASKATSGPVVTVAVNSLTFIKPLFIYDLVSFYPKVEKIGTTSIQISITVYAERANRQNHEWEIIKISEANLVYVAVSSPGVKRKI